MLGWAVAQHSAFGGCPEIDFIFELAGRGALHRSWRRSLRADGVLGRFDVTFEDYAANIGVGFEAVLRSRVDAPVLVDATPRHVRIWRELSLLFPDSRFIHLVRRGEDVVRSLLASGFTSRSASGVIPACLTLRRHLACGLELEAILAERTLRMDYEAIVADPNREMSRLFAFLGRNSESACVEFIGRRRINSSFGRSLDAQGAIQDRGDRRPLNALQKGVFRLLCARVCERAGARRGV